MNPEKVVILAQRLARLLPVRQLAFGAALLGLPALGVVTAFGLAPGTVADTVARSSVTVDMALPPWTEAEAPGPQRFTNQERVLRGDTVAGLVARLGIADEPASE